MLYVIFALLRFYFRFYQAYLKLIVQRESLLDSSFIFSSTCKSNRSNFVLQTDLTFLISKKEILKINKLYRRTQNRIVFCLHIYK